MRIFVLQNMSSLLVSLFSNNFGNIKKLRIFLSTDEWLILFSFGFVEIKKSSKLSNQSILIILSELKKKGMNKMQKII